MRLKPQAVCCGPKLGPAFVLGSFLPKRGLNGLAAFATGDLSSKRSFTKASFCSMTFFGEVGFNKPFVVCFPLGTFVLILRLRIIRGPRGSDLLNLVFENEFLIGSPR